MRSVNAWKPWVGESRSEPMLRPLCTIMAALHPKLEILALVHLRRVHWILGISDARIQRALLEAEIADFGDEAEFHGFSAENAAMALPFLRKVYPASLEARIGVSENPDDPGVHVDLEVEIEFPQPRLPEEPTCE